MRIPELTKRFNARFGLSKSEGQIKNTLQNHEIRCGRKPGFAAGYSFIFSREQEQFIRDSYPRLSLAALAAAFNAKFANEQKTARQIRNFIHNHHIKSGRTGCWEKGHVPANAGTKGVSRANSGTFKKGNIPGNIKPLYTERVDTRQGYILVKIPEKNPYTGAATCYEAKHIGLWKRRHGKIPKGHAILFKDGNQANCIDENLMLISRAELLRLNHHKYREFPGDLKPSVLAMAKLEVKTFKLLKNSPGGNS
jgi:hypothetical protein